MPITNFPPDLLIITQTNNYSNSGRPRFHTKLITNGDTYLASSSTASETTETTLNNPRFTNTGYDITASGQTTGAYVGYALKRAPGFMDVVCGTGTGANVNMSHNLGVIPELIIVRSRNQVSNWQVGFWGGGGSNAARTLALNVTNASMQSSTWSATATATTFATRGNAWVELFDQSTITYVAYLFATLAGVSKVGSYTGTGALLTVNCGFTSGARFVLIKRTDSTGDWYTYDSARGITSSNDPYLFLNDTSAEVTNTNYVDTDTTGFKVTAAAPAGLNASGGTYIFLAIA